MYDINKLMTVRHYARHKDVTVQSIYNWIELGKIKSIKIDGIMFIDIS